MALLKAGYWPTTYMPSNYWQEDYWPEYGAAAVQRGGGAVWLERRRRGVSRRRLYELSMKYLEVKVRA